MEEQWINIYNNLYAVSNLGRVKANISLTTLWRRVQDEKIINNHYFKLHL